MTREKPIVTPFVQALRPSRSVDEELEWFFNRAECDMGLTSNYEIALGRDSASVRRAPDDVVEPSHRYRCIRTWLKGIADSDAGVLQVAYELRPWPVELFDELGRLTGVVARLACALSAWPEDRETQQLVEMASAWSLVSQGVPRRGDASFGRLRREAELRFARAHQAYAVARRSVGGGRS